MDDTPVKFDRADLAYALLNTVIAEILTERPEWTSGEAQVRIKDYLTARDALLTRNVKPELVEELIREAKKELQRRWKGENE